LFGKTAANTVWVAAISIISVATSAPFLDAYKGGHQAGIKLHCQFWPITALAPKVTAFSSHSEEGINCNWYFSGERLWQVPYMAGNGLY
jgi:hypothetical protein